MVSLSATPFNNLFKLEENMFERALLDRAIDSSWNARSRRGLTALTSFGLQALAVAVLLILPLLRPQESPFFRHLSTTVSLGTTLGELPAPRTRAGGNPAAPSHPMEIFLRQPQPIQDHLELGNEDVPPQIGSGGPDIPGAVPGPGSQDGAFRSVGTGIPPVIPATPAPVVHSVRLSHMSEGDLVRKVLPTYPPLARSARIQCRVILQATISKLGTIENFRLVSGHPMLVPAAIEAVRQWRYRPYILNNEAVEVETQITVNFSLSGN
jgi:protein TonB